jgi:hypothetical protein
MIMNPKIIEILEKLGACGAALDWLRELPETTTLQEAWSLCENGAWLLWILVRWNPKDPKYHQFILRTARRALSTVDASADSTLTETLLAKETWLQTASSKDLEASIVWTKDPLWTATWDLVLDKTIQGPSWKQELKCWAEDIRDLFSRPEVREKKSKV